MISGTSNTEYGVSSTKAAVTKKIVEYATLLSDVVTYENNKAKITVPSLTPSMSTDITVDNKIPNRGGGNVINKDNLGATSITTTNYLEVEIPRYLFTIKEIQIVPNTRHGGEDNAIVYCNPKAVIVYNEFIKGQRFYVTDDQLVIGVVV